VSNQRGNIHTGENAMSNTQVELMEADLTLKTNFRYHKKPDRDFPPQSL
jgi:hypothetical protein